jgi:hypothetical protein
MKRAIKRAVPILEIDHGKVTPDFVAFFIQDGNRLLRISKCNCSIRFVQMDGITKFVVTGPKADLARAPGILSPLALSLKKLN